MPHHQNRPVDLVHSRAITGSLSTLVHICQWLWQAFSSSASLGAISIALVQVFYDFGLEEVVQQMFADPEFCKHRATERDLSDAGYYGTQEAARINKQTDGKLMKHSNSAYEWAIDDGQPFTFAKWSTGLLVMR